MQCRNNVASACADSDVLVTRPGPGRTHKRCPRCKNLLPVDRFGRKRQVKDGPESLASYCFACYRAVAKERHAANPEYAREWRRVNADRLAVQQAAHEAVRKAKAKGILVVPARCEDCGKLGRGKLQAHHWSYAEEHHLDVQWLCDACHHRWHADHEPVYPGVEMVKAAS